MKPQEVRDIFNYDKLTGNLIWKLKLNRRIKVGTIAGSISKDRVNIMIDYKNYKAHILVWCFHYGEWPILEIDHKDGNALNNKIENLRLATRKQNLANTAPRSTNLTGLKGVSKSKNKWLARINGTRIGLFNTKEEAAEAYKKVALELHGEFAYERRGDANKPEARKLDTELC